MPKSDNIITVRLNETQMKKYHEGKVFTLKASDINNLENHEVRLHFNAKKHLTRLIKNFNKGTGTRISPNDLIDVKVKTGDGMFDSLKGLMNSKLTKGIRLNDYKCKWQWYDLRISITAPDYLHNLADDIEIDIEENGENACLIGKAKEKTI